MAAQSHTNDGADQALAVPRTPTSPHRSPRPEPSHTLATARSGQAFPDRVVRLVRGGLLLTVLASGLLLAAPAEAAYPGANGRIVVVGQFGYIYSMKADGTDVRTLRKQDGDTLPAWSPDGGRIAFQSTSDQVMVMNADGTGAHQVTSTGGGQPAWSPDGTEIVFSSATGISTMNADGTGQAPVTSASDAFPAWSPNGTEIVFSRFDSGSASYNLWKVNANGTNPTQLTTGLVSDLYPKWSPDGGHIAFQRGDWSNSPQVLVINSDGSSPTQLTSTGKNGQPQWSPDGTQIAFLSKRGSGIWTMNPDGSTQTRRTKTPEIGTFDWQPRHLTIAVSKMAVGYNRPITVTVHLAEYATTTNTTLSIYKSPYGGARTLVATGSVDSHGNFSATTTIGRQTSFVATWSGDATHPAGGTSTAVSVLVRAAISGHLTGYYAIAGRHNYRLYHFHRSCPRHHTNCPIYTATVLPNHAGNRVSFTLQLRYGGRWHTALTFADTLGKRSSVKESLIYSGVRIIGYRTRIRATFVKDADHLTNTTPWSYFEVTP